MTRAHLTDAAIVAGILAVYAAGILTGRALWHTADRYRYTTGPAGMVYRHDRTTGATDYHNPHRRDWTPIHDQPTWNTTTPAADIPPDSIVETSTK